MPRYNMPCPTDPCRHCLRVAVRTDYTACTDERAGKLSTKPFLLSEQTGHKSTPSHLIRALDVGGGMGIVVVVA